MPRTKRPAAGTPTRVEAFVHAEEQRTNIPTAELETFMKEEDRAPRRVTSPRPSELLYPRDPTGDPQLVWRGKDDQDRSPLEVAAPPIYIQEKIHPKALVEDLLNQRKGLVPAQADLFSDFNGIAFDDLVDFYQHEQHWSNRMILGDSLEVMTSLAEREGLKGQVQMIYMDPPYGIRFASNWQVSTRNRDVKDGREEAVTRQPEQVKAFRDTWDKGIHSYLSYLRDRLVAAHALLARSGSIFLQMGDANVHLARALLDEVFGASHFVSLIAFKKTPYQETDFLPNVYDYIMWYAKDRPSAQVHKLYMSRSSDDTSFDLVETAEGDIRPRQPGVEGRPLRADNLTSNGASEAGSLPFEFHGVTYRPRAGNHWKTSPEGMARLAVADQLTAFGQTLCFKKYEDESPGQPYTNVWNDTVQSTFAPENQFVVQTYTKVIERCLLLSTSPGDLVFDPTCGSGTTAFVAERHGRRWITVDTSRVAVAIARQRLMSARFAYYRLADAAGRDLRRGFVYRTKARVMLKTIARDTEIRDGISCADIAKRVAAGALEEKLYDQPVEEKRIVRVTGPFTVDSLAASSNGPDGSFANGDDSSLQEGASDFTARIIDNLRAAGVQNTVRDERLTFDRLEPWPGRFIHAVGEYSEQAVPHRAAITIGPQYGTVDADLVRDAAKEAAGFFDILIVCGFAFGAYMANEFKQLGNLMILKASMNPDLSMGGDLLKKTGTGNLFAVFGEPDIEVRPRGQQVEVQIKGLDVYDPTTGQVRAHTTADIACWFIDTAYDGNSFFVRHAYFTGAGDPYKSLRAALKADIDEEAWASLYSTVSRPFDVPSTGRIAVKVINHYGDEVMKVYEIPETASARLPA